MTKQLSSSSSLRQLSTAGRWGWGAVRLGKALFSEINLSVVEMTLLKSFRGLPYEFFFIRHISSGSFAL